MNSDGMGNSLGALEQSGVTPNIHPPPPQGSAILVQQGFEINGGLYVEWCQRVERAK